MSTQIIIDIQNQIIILINFERHLLYSYFKKEKNYFYFYFYLYT